LDYRLYHLINEFAQQHSWLGRAASAFESWSFPLFALATVCLWLLARARPGSGSLLAGRRSVRPLSRCSRTR
jgi:hypothetical protein